MSIANPASIAENVERFRLAVADLFGLHFDDSKLAFLAELLRARAEASGCEDATYVQRVNDRSLAATEYRWLAQQLTVTETFFFRQIEQCRALLQVLSERMRESPSASIRLLSAGCATGEEPYSLAMLLRAQFGDAIAVRIRGVDLNPQGLERARRGRYTSWSLRETPPEQLARFFVQEGREYQLDAVIRGAVTFEERNLVAPNPELFWPASYDAVFCRNVLMYFAPEAARRIVAQIARSLVPGGFLFLGYAETLRGLSSQFHLRHDHGTFYYQLRDPAETAPLGHDQRSAAAAPVVAVAAPFTDSMTWVETIERSAERIHALGRTRPCAATPDPSAARVPSRDRIDLDPAFDLLRKERFAEALALIHELPPSSTRDPDVLLLRSVLFTHSGQLDLAEKTSRELLGLDEHSAGAHYLLALISEARGSREQAREHDQFALYLDPTFAMARLHLGLLALHTGERATARRELEQALLLLQREEGSRLLLFGGGFERPALVALCRAQLQTCGGIA